MPCTLMPSGFQYSMHARGACSSMPCTYLDAVRVPIRQLQLRPQPREVALGVRDGHVAAHEQPGREHGRVLHVGLHQLRVHMHMYMHTRARRMHMGMHARGGHARACRAHHLRVRGEDVREEDSFACNQVTKHAITDLRVRGEDVGEEALEPRRAVAHVLQRVERRERGREEVHAREGHERRGEVAQVDVERPLEAHLQGAVGRKGEGRGW